MPKSQLYQSLNNEIPPCDLHYYSRVSSPSCSWAEGFAWFVPALVLDSSTLLLTTGNVELNLEDGTYGHRTSNEFPSSTTGNKYSEGLVASALWDIYDSTNESGDNISDKLSDIWDAFDDSPAQNIEAWETEWNNNNDPSLDHVFNLNKIRINNPPTIPPDNNLITAFMDDFEGGLSLWILSGDSDWEIDDPEDDLPGSAPSNESLVSRDCDIACIATVSSTLSTQNSLTVSFDRYVDRSIDTNEGLFVEYSTDGTNWITLTSFTPHNNNDDDLWHNESVVFNIAENTAKIRFVAKSNVSNEHVEIDNVVIGLTAATPPDDGGGNGNPPPNTATQTVTVRDTVPPSITPVPFGVYVSVGADAPSTIDFEVPDVTDAVDATVTASCTPAPGALLSPGVTVVMCTASDASGNSASMSFTLNVNLSYAHSPQILSADVTDSAVVLDWYRPTFGGDVTGYQILRSNATTTDMAVIWQGVSTSFVDYTVLPDTEYTYQAISVNGTRISAPSNAVTVMTDPAGLVGLMAISTDGAVTLTWNDVPGADRYVVRKSVAVDSLISRYAWFLGGDILTVTDHSVSAGETFVYHVVADDRTDYHNYLHYDFVKVTVE